MKKNALTALIESFVSESINEILGKFNFSEFKKLAASSPRPKTKEEEEDFAWGHKQHPEIAYAKKFLPELGQGSSRITFAISGGKVLKIAMNQAGFGQNKEEVDLFTRSGKNELITKIFDLSPDYKWIISELVKPLSDQEFQQILQISPGVFETLIRNKTFPRTRSSVENWLNLRKADYRFRIRSYQQEAEALQREDPPNLARIKSKLQMAKMWMKDFEEWKNIKFDSPGIRLVLSLRDLLDREKGLLVADVARKDHFGRTVDGQVKLLDYGYTEEVQDKFY